LYATVEDETKKKLRMVEKNTRKRISETFKTKDGQTDARPWGLLHMLFIIHMYA